MAYTEIGQDLKAAVEGYVNVIGGVRIVLSVDVIDQIGEQDKASQNVQNRHSAQSERLMCVV